MVFLMPLETVLSYANADREYAVQLERHLVSLARTGAISIWHRDKVTPGSDASQELQQRMESAAIIVLLVSADLEIEREHDIETALRQRELRGARVIPVLLRPVDLASVRYSALRMLPDGPAVALRSRASRDEAWVEVVSGLRRVIATVQSQNKPQGRTHAADPPHLRALSPSQANSAGSQDVQPATPKPPLELVKILFLAANPTDRSRLAIDEEIRDINRRIRMGQLHHRLQLEQEWAVKAVDLSQMLLKHRPAIVHFSGHGSSLGELLLLDENGKGVTVPIDALSQLFRIMAPRGVRCVVLNACYSAPQANAISQHVDCVVGISGQVSDQAAIAFSAGFYTGLAEGETVQVAFELGCLQISLLSYYGVEMPVLTARSGVDLASLRLTA